MSKIVTGHDLRNDLLNLTLTRKAIISELLFERDIFLLTADAGAGKSIFGTLMAACLSFRRPFLGLDIPEAKKVMYVQLEGDYEESIERLRYMEMEGGKIIEEKNLLWVEEKTLDVLDKASVQGFFARINETEFKPDVVIIDPIYKLSAQDISTGVAALGVIHFSDAIISKWNCANVLIHHNLKESYAADGNKVKRDDAYYGHSFIKNHIRTSYAMKITGDYTRDIIRMKGRGSDTRKRLSLEYNPESYCLDIAEHVKAYKRGQHYERFYLYLEACRQAKRQTDAKDIIEECEITYDQLRALKKKPETLALFTINKSGEKNREIWTPKID